jgi:hypothetical protein
MELTIVPKYAAVFGIALILLSLLHPVRAVEDR